MTFDPTLSISDIVTAFMALASVGAVLTTLYVYRKEREPRISLFLESDADNGSVSLVVRNDGSSAARNVRLPGFDWDMAQLEDLSIVRKSFISKGIPMLAPGCERRTMLCTTGYAGGKLLGKEVVQHVDYERRTWRGVWKHCWDEFTLDYYSFAHTVYMKSDEHLSRVATENIAKESRKQTDALKAIEACANELSELARGANGALEELDARRKPGGERDSADMGRAGRDVREMTL